MASGPDLFVVCKSCGSEVSPYITECPYCGTRLRKRAPKLERGGTPKAPRGRTRRTQLPRLRPGEIPGIRADRRPWAVWGLLLGSIGLTIAINVGLVGLDKVILATGGFEAPWRALTTVFAYTHSLYEVVVLAAIALFGWLLERRHGAWAPLLVFLVCGCGGALFAVKVAGDDFALGANGAALGMVGAWVVRDLLGRRRGIEDDSDLLGVLAIAAVLVLLPIASDDASAAAGFAGGLAGLIIGLGLAPLASRG
jgi:membrane associated rhomboid family serine protease